jgi:inosine-uridine nucleoside N-ribohydrolase
MFTQEMLDEIVKSKEPAAQYLAKYSAEKYYLWDELAAAAWLDPKIVTRECVVYLDVDTSQTASYGDTQAWTEAMKPDLDLQPVHWQDDVDTERFYREFIGLMKLPAQKR